MNINSISSRSTTRIGDLLSLHSTQIVHFEMVVLQRRPTAMLAFKVSLLLRDTVHICNQNHPPTDGQFSTVDTVQSKTRKRSSAA
jgi:hypothetical protein